MSEPWYAARETHMLDLSDGEGGVFDELHGRETPDGWEYAIVRRRGRDVTAYPIFKNGVVMPDD